jgi:hypothetical protein
VTALLLIPAVDDEVAPQCIVVLQPLEDLGPSLLVVLLLFELVTQIPVDMLVLAAAAM